jgi:hypothetical protein
VGKRRNEHPEGCRIKLLVTNPVPSTRTTTPERPPLLGGSSLHLSRFGATLDRCLVEGDSMDELTEFLLDDGKPADF